MKKLLFIFAGLFSVHAAAQCVITGPAEIAVGQKLTYSAETDREVCSDCYRWIHRDQKIFLESGLHNQVLTARGAVPGKAVLELEVKTTGKKQKCKKTIQVVTLPAVPLGTEDCTIPADVITESRLDSQTVAFSLQNAADGMEYLWTVTYKSGENKTAAGKKVTFPYSLQQAIDKVEVNVKSKNCTKKISKNYDQNFWYFF